MFKTVRTYARSVPHVHGHKRSDGGLLADRGINDRLVELGPLVEETRKSRRRQQ